MTDNSTASKPPGGPVRPTDDEARALARSLIEGARHAALGVLENGAPMVTRIALGTSPDGGPLTLISDLSHHTKALKADPACSVLVGEPGPKGDPLTYPRLTMQCRARFVGHDHPEYKAIAKHYLATHPKSKLYIGFGDFSFALFDVSAAYLNGGFGKAYNLTRADLAQKGAP